MIPKGRLSQNNRFRNEKMLSVLIRTWLPGTLGHALPEAGQALPPTRMGSRNMGRVSKWGPCVPRTLSWKRPDEILKTFSPALSLGRGGHGRQGDGAGRRGRNRVGFWTHT